MPWYYADNGQQTGPVTDEEFQSLLTSGKVRADTLVWRDGMPGWAPYSTVMPASAAPSAFFAGPDPGVPGGVLCAECGKTFPPDQVIRIADRNVCATCKPILVQRLAEGAAPAATPGAWISEDQLLQREYRVEIGTALERSWALFTKNPGPIIGVTLLAGVLLIACSVVGMLISMVVPMGNVLVQPLYLGPLTGGLLWFFLRLSRGEAATVSDLFDGFSKRFVQLFLALLVQSLITVACLIPVGIVAVVMGISMGAFNRGGGASPPGVAFIMGIAIAGLFALVAITYLNTLWTHSLLLIMDKNMKFWPAMQLSRKLVSKGWWMTFLLLLLGGTISGVGALLCLIGLAATVPIYYGMKVYFYDDNFRDLQPAVH
jgi:hypothetical protein